MKTVQFVIPGQPKGKARPRVITKGQHVHTYTPKETVEYENYVRIMYQEQCRGIRLQGAIRADIIAYFPVPKSTSKKKRALMLDGKIRYTKKIDCDNLAKAILDSLNCIAYDDDSQVCELDVEKWYGEGPRVVVLLSELEQTSS